MFRRSYIGLDICAEGVRGIAVQRRGRHVALTGGQILDFSENVFRASTKELNVLNPDLYVDAIREVLLPLAGSEERVALSLPDATGYTFLLQLDTPLKSRQQGTDILKWQLKDRLPEGFRDYSLQYQVLSELESGSKKVLVSVIDNKILNQFEDLMERAGFNASLIDFHSFHLYNCYRSKTDLGDDFILLGASGKELILLGFHDKSLGFYRVKTVGLDPEQFFREINRSLVSYDRENPSRGRSKVYLHTDWVEQETLLDAARTAFNSEIHLLPDPLSQLKSGDQKLVVPQSETAKMAAALGSAERLMDKVI